MAKAFDDAKCISIYARRFDLRPVPNKNQF
jgi:hypothetical protein